MSAAVWIEQDIAVLDAIRRAMREHRGEQAEIDFVRWLVVRVERGATRGGRGRMVLPKASSN